MSLKDHWGAPMTEVVTKALLYAAGTAIVLLFFSAAITAEPGLDYFIDAGTPIDALARGDWREFYANQPLMGSFSLFLRAPFVAAVYHQSASMVYVIGSRADHRSRCSRSRRGCCGGCSARAARRPSARWSAPSLILSPLSVRAIHWGHPEELLGAALCVAAVIVASRGKGVLAGLLLGCAITTKQWAVLAALPAFVATPGPARVKLVVASVLTALAFTAPMVAGNSDRFFQIQRAAGSADPQYVLDGGKGSGLPGSHVTPTNVYLPFAFTYQHERGTIYLQDERIGRLSHPLIILLAIPLTLLLWRRGRPGVREALQLLALLFLARCVLDPMSLDYYHVPFLVALGAAAAFGTARDARLALYATAGLAIAFAVPIYSMYELSRDAYAKNAVYLACRAPARVGARPGSLRPARAKHADAAAPRCRWATRVAERDRTAGSPATGPSRPRTRARAARARRAACRAGRCR